MRSQRTFRIDDISSSSTLSDQLNGSKRPTYSNMAGLARALTSINSQGSYDEASVSSAVHEQIYGTCYAHATATIIRAVEKRIIGREPVKHEVLVNQLTTRWGNNGAIITKVLDEECGKRQLGYEMIDANKCREAIKMKHPVLATFFLCRIQWQKFSKFFKDHPDKIITSNIIGPFIFDIDDRESGGHAVVITAQTDSYWLVKNSWGPDFADGGYFKIDKNALKLHFYHVYFVVTDLTEKDRENYQKSLENIQEPATPKPQSDFQKPRPRNQVRERESKGHLVKEGSSSITETVPIISPEAKPNNNEIKENQDLKEYPSGPIEQFVCRATFAPQAQSSSVTKTRHPYVKMSRGIIKQNSQTSSFCSMSLVVIIILSIVLFYMFKQ